VSFVFFNAELDRPPALSYVHLAAFTGCKFCIQNLHQCTRLHTDSSEPQPQHLVPNTTCGSIIRIQPNTPEDGHTDTRNM
jgi:hypothetical protein